jgi:hypothetical protein
LKRPTAAKLSENRFRHRNLDAIFGNGVAQDLELDRAWWQCWAMDLALKLDARFSPGRESRTVDDDPLSRAHPIRTKSMDFEEFRFNRPRASDGKQ